MGVFSRKAGRAESSSAKPVNLKLIKINFWSAVRFSFVLNVALGIGLVIALTTLFLILNAAGFSALLKQYKEITLPTVLSISLGIAVFMILVGTILAGIWAAIFNIVARIIGGVSVGFTNNNQQ
jgi:hypothetical protein